MKRTIPVIFLLLSVWQSHAQTNISFEATGITGGDIYLGYHRAEQKFVEDTLAVGADGVVLIQREEQLTPGLYFLYQPNTFYQEFIVNEPSFSIKGDGRGYTNFQVEGSKENEVFKAFQLELGQLQRERNVLVDSLSKLSGQDSTAIMEQIIALNDRSEASRRALYEQNPDLLISKMIRLMSVVPVEESPEIEDEKERRLQAYRAYRKAFWDRLDFKDEGLLRTPVFKANVLKYINEIVPQIPDSLILEVDKVIEQAEDNPVTFRYWLVTFTNQYQNSNTMGMDAVLVHLLKKYYFSGRADWVEEAALATMREEVAFLEPNLIGKKAPSLALVDTTYSPMRPLEDLSEEFLVLYFYDPECGHCKKKTPILRDNYYDLKDLGAEVVAICTISDVDVWKNYIREKELDWINLADLSATSRFRADYDIRSVPRVYVLNGERKIIAKRLDVEQVADFIRNYQAIYPVRGGSQ